MASRRVLKNCFQTFLNTFWAPCKGSLLPSRPYSSACSRAVYPNSLLCRESFSATSPIIWQNSTVCWGSNMVTHRNLLTLCSPVFSRVLNPSPVSLSSVRLKHKSLSLLQIHLRGPVKKRQKKKPLDGRPQMKGIVLKTLIKKPKKPNSANRKCVLVRLSNGREAIAYIPGVGHNLQEHNVVLVRCGRVNDLPGVKLKVIRGKYDCAHVVKRSRA